MAITLHDRCLEPFPALWSRSIRPEAQLLLLLEKVELCRWHWPRLVGALRPEALSRAAPARPWPTTASCCDTSACAEATAPIRSTAAVCRASGPVCKRLEWSIAACGSALARRRPRSSSRSTRKSTRCSSAPSPCTAPKWTWTVLPNCPWRISSCCRAAALASTRTPPGTTSTLLPPLAWPPDASSI